MATLNIAETDDLRKAVAAIESILRDGFDPNTAVVDIKQANKKRLLEKTRSDIRTILTMKGHYPS